MTSIGETLRRERVLRKLDLDSISKELKISTKLLEAMEADRFDKLPGGIFTRSFVRQYARTLGLDEQDIAASLQRMLEPPPVQPEIPEPKKPATMVVWSRVEHWPTLVSNFPTSSSMGALALMVVVVLICSEVYSWSQRGPRTVTVPTIAQTVKPLRIEHRPETPTPPARATIQIAGSAERLAAPVRVQLSAAEPVWVFATADGKHAFSTTVEPNTSRVIEANYRVFLKLGNAGGIRLWLNGKPLGLLGVEGEVVRVQFTSGGFQLVPVEAAPTPGASESNPGDSRGEPLAPL